MTQEAIIDHYFGGDYAHWTHGHRWLLLHLDMRYTSIISHEGIFQFSPLFGEFRDAVKAYCQKDEQRNSRPRPEQITFQHLRFIVNTIDLILVPFSSLAGDYEGEPHRPQYILAQELVYSGNKKLHGNKMETVFFPNGISTCFGPVSAWQNDREHELPRLLLGADPGPSPSSFEVHDFWRLNIPW
jgi:hypothetical protein